MLTSGSSLVSRVSIGAGTTFDISALTSPYSSPPLAASGNASPATLVGAAGGEVDASSPSLCTLIKPIPL